MTRRQVAMKRAIAVALVGAAGCGPGGGAPCEGELRHDVNWSIESVSGDTENVAGVETTTMTLRVEQMAALGTDAMWTFSFDAPGEVLFGDRFSNKSLVIASGDWECIIDDPQNVYLIENLQEPVGDLRSSEPLPEDLQRHALVEITFSQTDLASACPDAVDQPGFDDLSDIDLTVELQVSGTDQIESYRDKSNCPSTPA